VTGSDVCGSGRLSKRKLQRRSSKSHRFATGGCKGTDSVSTELADTQAYEACTKSQAYERHVLWHVGVWGLS
jgi:hypothetical protein